MTEGHPISHLPKRIPERTCIGCRCKGPASELVCLVAPEGQLRVAHRGRVQAGGGMLRRGRGAWVHPRCFGKALRNVGRAFRRQVEVSDQQTLLAQVHSVPGQSINAQGDLR